MDFSIEQMEQIDAYIDNLLLDEKRDKFLERLKSDKVLQREVLLQLRIRQVLEREEEKGIREKMAHLKVSRGKKLHFKSFSVAASLVLVMGVCWIVYDSYHIPEEAKGRAKSFKMEDQINRERGAKVNKEWTEALEIISGDKKKVSKKEAKEILKKIASNPKHPYQKKAKVLLESL